MWKLLCERRECNVMERTVGAALRGRPCAEFNYRRGERRLSRAIDQPPILECRQGAATEGRPYSAFHGPYGIRNSLSNQTEELVGRLLR